MVFALFLTLAAAPLPKECEQPALREVAPLKELANLDGAFSAGLDAVATWCFDSAGAWNAGQLGKPKKKIAIDAPPAGDCLKAITSCESTFETVKNKAPLRELAGNSLLDFERPYRGAKYTPKRSGLREVPSEAADCRSKSRTELFQMAQHRMDLARLTSQIQNEYGNYKTWLFTRGLECRNEVAANKRDPTVSGVSIDQSAKPEATGPTSKDPELAAALALPIADKWRAFAKIQAREETDRDFTLGFLASRELRGCDCVRVNPAAVVRALEKREGGEAGLSLLTNDDPANTRCAVCMFEVFPVWSARSQKQCASLDALSDAELAKLAKSDDANGLPPRCLDDVKLKRAEQVRLAMVAQAEAQAKATADAKLVAAAGTGAARPATTPGTGSAAAGAQGGARPAGTGAGAAGTGAAGTGAAGTGAAGTGAAGTGAAGTGAAGTGAAGTGAAGTGAAGTGAAGTGSRPGSTAGAGTAGAGTAGAGTAGTGTAGAGTAGAGTAGAGTAGAGTAGAGTAGVGTTGARPGSAGTGATGTGAVNTGAANAGATGAAGTSGAAGATGGKPGSAGAGAAGSGAVGASTAGTGAAGTGAAAAGTGANSNLQTGVDGYTYYRPGGAAAPATGNAAATDPAKAAAGGTTAPAIGATAPASGTATPGTTVAGAQGGGLGTPTGPGADDFKPPDAWAPIPTREDGRIYVRVFMSRACIADVNPGPLQARTGDLLLLPFDAKFIQVKSPCGGLAEVYFGREARPRVSENFGRGAGLKFEFKRQ